MARRPRFNAALLSLFALTGLLLSTVGLAGVLWYLVEQRTREIGLRSALGATAGSIAGLILGIGARWMTVGVTAGVLLSLAAARWVDSMLYGVKAHDPATYIGMAFLMCATASVACAIPALRAARVDPLLALREE